MDMVCCLTVQGRHQRVQCKERNKSDSSLGCGLLSLAPRHRVCHQTVQCKDHDK